MRLALTLLALVTAASPAPPPVAVRVAPTQTRVAFASVQLALGDLEVQGGELVGDFKIHVPLFPARDDHGRVSLRTDLPLEEVLREGGRFAGKANSQATGRVHDVRGSVDAAGHVLIAVTTSDRTLQFASRYTIVR